MDYGKMAYLKVEDLEGRIKTEEQRIKTIRACFSPIVSLSKHDLTEIKGSGTTTAIVKLTLRGDNNIQTDIVLKYGSTRVAETNVFIGKGELREYVFLATIYVEEGLMLSVEAEYVDYLTLMRAEIVLLGNAEIGRDANDYCCDISNENVGLITVIEERLEAACFMEDAINLESKAVIGIGHRADIVGVDGGFVVIYCDNNNNIWGVKLDYNMTTKSLNYFGQANMETIAVTKINNKLCVAYTECGEIKTFMTDCNIVGRSNETNIIFEKPTEGVKFVKNAPYPMLIIKSGGHSYLKTAEPEENVAENLNLGLEITITGVA